tara:strand:+ start:923 stop:1678 length:756 start_codon:yes stop_codon:yes gene_type:complete
MEIQQRRLDTIKPYLKNPRKNDIAVKDVADSITKFGFRQPIVIDEKDIIVVGHTRYKAAKYLKLDTVPVTIMKGVSPELIAKYRIADNKLNELADWDNEILIQELDDVLEKTGSLDFTGFDTKEIDKLRTLDEGREYSTKIDTPIYTPKGDKPSIKDLVNDEQYNKLCATINTSKCSNEVKEFLLIAAQRHRRFDYEQIAEYYSHTDAHTQRLMEASALVIVDFDTAIENGYVRLTDTLKQIFDKDYPDEQ